MKKILILTFILFNFVYEASSQKMIKIDSRKQEIGNWIETNFKRGKVPPFSFDYNGINSSKFINRWVYKKKIVKSIVDGRTSFLISYQDPKSGLRVECTIKGYNDYNTVEWVLHFTNDSKENSKQISNIRTTDFSLQCNQKGAFNLYYANGSNASREDFAPRDKKMVNRDSLYMRPSSGRSSDNTAFPFFNIETPSHQGVLVAIGWSGTWFSKMKCTDNNTITMATGIERLNTYLKPHESMRSSSVCLLFWKGNRMNGHNAFRRFLLAHHSRHIDGKPVYYPMSCGFNWGDPAPCNEYSCLTTEYAIALIQRTKLFKMVPEVYWLDAGWYAHSGDYFDGKDWANTVGNWVVDSVRFENGLRPIADAAHKLNSKFMVWFEPERVYPGSLWAKEHPEWLLKTDNENLLFNLGNPEALHWMCKYIGDFLEENGIDYYRQDFNIAPENAWKNADEPQREGMTEVKYIEGLYAYWDYLLKRFPNLLIDNCASGGRRLDYETIARSAPLWRTDYQYGEPVGYQCHTYGLEFFLPQHGTGAYQVDHFDFRSSLGSAVVFNWKLTQMGQSYLDMQKSVEEFKKVRPYFYEDFYPLSGTGDLTGDDIWLAYQLHKPSDETGYIVAFRRSKNTQTNYEVHLSALNPDKTYVLLDEDTGKTIKKSGKELSTSLMLKSDSPRSSLLIKYYPDNK